MRAPGRAGSPAGRRVIAAGCLAVGLAIGSTVGIALAAMAITLPALLVQDTWRFALFAHDRGRSAFVNDLVWLLVQLPALAFAFSFQADGDIIALALLAWALAGAVAALRRLLAGRGPAASFRQPCLAQRAPGVDPALRRRGDGEPDLIAARAVRRRGAGAASRPWASCASASCSSARSSFPSSACSWSRCRRPFGRWATRSGGCAASASPRAAAWPRSPSPGAHSST